jgi:DNA-binding transcriptional MerR regulator
MLSLNPATLRNWEARYGIVVPDRSTSGRRLYSEAEVEQLRAVCVTIAGGASAADAHRLLAARLADGAG